VSSFSDPGFLKFVPFWIWCSGRGVRHINDVTLRWVR